MPNKKTLDKESMFRKIMPSAAEAGPATGTALAQAPAPVVATPAASPLKSPRVTGPGISDENLPHPINLAELVAEQLYPSYLARMDGCLCQRCRDDTLGIALNKVKPRYIASDRFTPADLEDRQLVSETVTALMHALMVVKNSPHHDENDIMRLQ